MGRGGSNEYPQSMFRAEIWKISEFFVWKFSFFSVYLNRRVFVMDFFFVCVGEMSISYSQFTDVLTLYYVQKQ